MFHDMASSIEELVPGVSSSGYSDNLGGEGNVPRARRQAQAFRGA